MGQCASIGTQCHRVSEFQPCNGTLVLLHNAETQRASRPQPQSKQAMYMVKAQDTWHSFHAVGFLIESPQGNGTFNAVLSGSLPFALTQHANPGLAALIPLSDVLSCEGVNRIAIAELQPPLTHQEVLGMKSFVQRCTQEFGIYHDRANLISGRGRKVFLSALIGEMLWSIGRMEVQRVNTHPHHLYSSSNRSWVMPDLMFLDQDSDSPLHNSEGTKRNTTLTSTSGIVLVSPSALNAKESRRQQQGAVMSRVLGTSSAPLEPHYHQVGGQIRHGSVDLSAHVSAPIGITTPPRVSPHVSRTNTVADTVTSACAIGDDGGAKPHSVNGRVSAPNLSTPPATTIKAGSAPSSSVFLVTTLGTGASKTMGGSPRTPASVSHALSTGGGISRLNQWDSVGSDVGTVLQTKAPFSVGVSGLSATLQA